MIIGIMQPYFFPYLGYFSLIKQVDEFILLDEVQFIRHGWIERNRILKPTRGWQYFRIPLKSHSRDTKIKDILLENNKNWKKRIIAQLQHYKKDAPYFTEVIDLLRKIFDNEFNDVSSLNMKSLIEVCKYLKIHTPIKLYSEMNIEIDPVNASDEWALNISKAVKADEYWNPPGGKDFFNREKFIRNNIALYFHECEISKYDQKRPNFEPGLSIVDVMMFNEPEKINHMLDKYELS